MVGVWCGGRSIYNKKDIQVHSEDERKRDQVDTPIHGLGGATSGRNACTTDGRKVLPHRTTVSGRKKIKMSTG